MKRDFYTGEFTFSHEEIDTIALGISNRCEYTLQMYRTTLETKNCGAVTYFANEFNAAAKLYKLLFGIDYPADTAEGAVPTADNAEDNTDSTIDSAEDNVASTDC